MSVFLQSQITIKITSLPKDTPQNAKIFVASSLNQWNPNDPNYLLKKDNSGNYFFQIPTNLGDIEYKFTQGSWETVEGDIDGNQIENRKFTSFSNSEIIENRILSWQKSNTKPNTVSKNVSILSNNFHIPQLKKNRKIWVYLPPDYETSGKKYSVIYMEDGQNLFDESTSFSGEWHIDETLNQLFSEGKQDAIIIGIDNGGNDRLDEYSPWKNPKYGGGDGDLYADFLAKTLKPYIDKKYRTKIQAKYTALIGSSMGGLISFYAGVKYPEKFGKLGIFSPAFWFAFNDLSFFISKNSKNIKSTQFYFLAGQNESKEMVPDIEKVVSMLEKNGVKKENIFKKLDQDGTHSESYWSQEFRNAYLWLFR